MSFSCRSSLPFSLIPAFALLTVPFACFAVSDVLYDVVISTVAVNGGADSTNPGTTCVQISPPLPAVCPSGYAAIMNNNKQLIAAALLNKATASKVNIYYENAASSNHCPAFTFTPCVINSIQSK